MATDSCGKGIPGRVDLGGRPPKAARGQTDLEVFVEKLLNRSDPEATRGYLKPFRWNPAGNQSRPVEPDQQPEASLAWWVGDHPCEA